MKNILVPIDFTESSESAKAIAIKIAKQTGAEIHYLHSSETVSVVREGNEEHQLEERLKSFASGPKNVKVETFVTDGVPFDDIITHSEDFESGLIILCTDGSKTYHSNFSASNVLRVTRLASCPVLIVPHSQKEVNFEKIVFASDFTYEFDYKEQVEKVFNNMLGLTSSFSPEINLLYVKMNGEPEDKVKKCMEDFSGAFADVNIKSNIIRSKSVENGILGFSKEHGAGVVCMIGHGSGNYYTQLRTSISEKLIAKTDVPVLIIRVSN